MQIGIDVDFLPRDRRGMGRYVRNVLRAWLARRPEHDYVLLCRTLDDEPEIRRALEELGLADAGELVRAVPRLKAHLTDVCWYPWNRLDPPLKGRLNAVTVHDVAPFVFPQRGLLRRLDQAADGRRLHRSARMADLVFTDSEFSRREVSRYLGVPEHKTAAVHMGVDQTFRALPPGEKDEVLLARLGVTRGFVLFAGADDERRNLGRLLQAFRLAKEGFDTRHKLVVCGTPTEVLCTYEDSVQDVVAVGIAGDEELAILYRRATAFVFPSLYEGFGLPVLEAMASGAPVLCSRAAALPEIAGDAALYCDPYDVDDIARHLSLLLAHGDLRRQLSQRGLQQAKPFTWAATASAILAGLEDLVEGRQAPSRSPHAN